LVIQGVIVFDLSAPRPTDPHRGQTRQTAPPSAAVAPPTAAVQHQRLSPTAMAVPGGHLHTSKAQADPLDDEWERFQANGCPDWWLLAKYVSQAASRIPHQPFRSATGPSWVGSPPSGTHGASSSSAPTGQQEAHGVELLLQQQQQQQQPSSKDVAAAAAGEHNKPEAGRPPSPDAVPTSSPCKQPPAAAQTAAAPTACGLKGIFGCTGGCTPPCTAAKSADQTA
jgi:hypothetical protein